jgi:hypothetical protein
VCLLRDAAPHPLQPDEQRALIDRRNRVGLLPYAGAIVAAVISSYLTLAICAGLAIFYALPSTTDP